MPSSILINGLRLYKPGIYGYIDVSSLGGKGISTGNVAVVGDFPLLQHETDGDILPLTFTSGRAVQEFGNDREMLDVAKFAFTPSVDSRVPGGAASLTFVPVRPNTQASSAGYVGFADANGIQCITLKSRLWGPKGNQVLVKANTNATDLNGMDVDIYFNGIHEPYVNLQSGVIADLYYDGADATASLITLDKTTWTWTWDIATAFTAPGGAQSIALEPTEIVVAPDSVLAAKLVDGGAGASSAAVTCTIVGLDELGGAQTVIWTALAGTTDFGSGAGVYHATADKWSRIDSITLATADVAYNGTLTVQGTAFAITTADFDSVGAICSYIDNNSAKGFHANGLSPQINNIPCSPDLDLDSNAGGVDKQTAVDVFSPAKCEVKADLWYIATTLDASNIVSCEQVTAGVNPPRFVGQNPAVEDQTFLFGGTISSATSVSWDNALESIEYSDIQIVVIFDDTIAYMKKGITHCNNSAVAGYERDCWMGATKDKTIAQILASFTAQLNNQNAACVGQEVQVTDSRGKTMWKDPKYLAVLCAGMQAGTPVATPLTTKRPDVLDVRQKWNANRDANELLGKGLCVLHYDDNAWRVVRSITTYMEDDNPILSEVSSWESIQTSVRSLRASLKIMVGNPIYANTAPKLRPVVQGLLDKQVEDGIIKAHRNSVVEDLGDTFRIGYEAAAVEPLNFFQVYVSVVRISSV